MNKFRIYLKREIDVDFFACVHGMGLVFIYGLELYVCGVKNLSFVTIIELFVLAYLIAWFQKLLFIKEKVYGKVEFRIRAALWCVGPNVFTWIGGMLFQWYAGVPKIVEPIFYISMLCYYVMIWFIVQLFYKDETKELNQKLSDIKQKRWERTNE